MARRDYASLDEDDFYGQGFEKKGALSVWIFQRDPSPLGPNVDTLQDLCGVGYYDLDWQEVIAKKRPTNVATLVRALSYSRSFEKAVVAAAAAAGVAKGWVVVAQYDFAYDRARVKRRIARDPRFIGVFDWQDDDD